MKFATKNDNVTQMTLSPEGWSEYFTLPNSGLRAYFNRVVEGQPDEYRTPFFKGKSLEEILSGWDATLHTLDNKWPGLVDFEIDLRNKVGPMSIMKPLKDRYDDIASYYDSILLESKPISDEAKRALLAEWRPRIGGIRLRSVENTVYNMQMSTNSGNPYFMKRKLAYHKMDRIMVNRIWNGEPGPDSRNAYSFEQSWKTGKHRKYYGVCAILGWRGQEGGPEKDDVKQRVVWMFPLAVNIKELQFYQPLIAAIQQQKLVPAYVSMDCVDYNITKLFDTKGKDDLVICTDFSKFDQHFNGDMQECAKTIYTALGADTDWLKEIYPIKYNIPLACEWENLIVGPHGMGSGSGGTNADETVTHRCLQHEAALNAGSDLNLYSQCLGDDGILSFPGCTVDNVLGSYTQHGQEMNFDKQSASPLECVYLRRWHNYDYRIKGICVGVYSTYRALGRLAEQERYYDPEKWNCKMVALRQLSILENVKYHPLREEFVAYCMKGDKYRLGIDIPGFLDNIQSIADQATEYMPDFLGYTKSMQHGSDLGIKNWWIVQYLKKLK